MPQIKILACVLFFTGFCIPVTSQNLPEASSKIHAAIENRNFAVAASELENLKRSDRKAFETNNYDYLLARAFEKNNDFAAALANYQAVVNRNSILTEYALWHLSQVARATGNLLLERIYLQQFFALAAPASLLVDAANARLAHSYFESKDFAAAIEILRNQTPFLNGAQTVASENQQAKIENQKSIDRTPKARENLALLGRAYLESGRAAEARDAFNKLLNELRDAAQPDDFALTAAKSLDELDSSVGAPENFGKTAPTLPEAEHLRRAFAYQFNRNFPLARLHYRAIVERYPQSGSAADALFQIGRGFAQEGDFGEAVNWFERAAAEFPDAPTAKDALSQAASAYARAGKPKVAIARYQTFIEKYPDADNLERAFLNIVDVLRDQGEDTNALKWALKTQQVFKGKLPEAVALFAQTRIHISLEDWQGALDDLNALQNFPDLGGARVPGGTNKAEVAFLKGFVLERLSRYAEAIDVYLSIPDGRGEYYGWRATERLKALTTTANETSKVAAEAKLVSLLKQLSAAQSANTSDFSPVFVLQSVLRLTILRLTNSSALRAAMLQKLKASYQQISGKSSSNYKIPNFKLLDFGRTEILKEKRAIKNQNYHRILADELLFLGLYDEAAPEIEFSLMENAKLKSGNTGDENNPKSKIQNPKSADLAYTLAVFYNRGDMSNRAVAFAEPLWKNVPADYQIELIPRDQIELLYPAPYADNLLRFASEKSVDARFLLSIMRQESRFRADVKSNAAARGLMQFISTTGEKLAGELGRTNFKQDELYNPPTAILFGSQYLSDLFKIFPSQPQAVAAGYNGGEDNMLRWLKRANTSDADRYVPEIVFTQSKDYVYKVLANYRVYRMFYDEKLK